MDLNVDKLTPVKVMPLTGSLNAGSTRAESGMLTMEIVKITSKALLALANVELPARHNKAQKTNALVSSRYCHQ